MSNPNPLRHALLDGVLGSSNRGSDEPIVVTTPGRSKKSPKSTKPVMSDAEMKARKALKEKVDRSVIGLQDIWNLVVNEEPFEVRKQSDALGLKSLY